MNIMAFQTKGQKGAVAIIAALSLPILVGFTGLALDIGRLYVDKTELQNATDACALAAARELTCDVSAGPCASSFLINAENSGIAVAARNKNDFQSRASTISAQDIKFSTTFTPASSYISRAGGASPASKFVMCTTQQTGIVPWFMQVLGAGNQTVGAQAVATLASSQANCAIPIGACKRDAAPASDPFAGMVIGQWLTTKLSESATGSFDWVDFTPPGGGASELADLLSGTGACSVPPPPTQVGEQGSKTSLGTAWNTRFGLYKGSNSITASPPDYTGESYTPTSWPSKFNAYGGMYSGAGTAIPNFLTARTQHTPYQGADGLNINMGGVTQATAGNHATLGADRRLATVPLVDCTAWKASSPQTVPILGYACVLMLHPMDKDNGPNSTDDVWLEYRGKSTDPGSPCATSGSVGGPGSIGPLVPSLVQ
jgi:Flp pilus assembly protein TadG